MKKKLHRFMTLWDGMGGWDEMGSDVRMKGLDIDKARDMLLGY